METETVRGLNAMSQGAPAALGIGAFAEKTLVHSGQCTKVDPEERPAAVGLLGCGVTAGLGAAINIGEMMRRGDNVVLVGVPTPDEKVPRIPLLDVFSRGGSLKSSWYGDCLPSRDFPVLVDLYRRGRLDLDAFVSEEIALDEVERASDRMEQGEVLRSVVVL